MVMRTLGSIRTPRPTRAPKTRKSNRRQPQQGRGAEAEERLNRRPEHAADLLFPAPFAHRDWPQCPERQPGKPPAFRQASPCRQKKDHSPTLCPPLRAQCPSNEFYASRRRAAAQDPLVDQPHLTADFRPREMFLDERQTTLPHGLAFGVVHLE